jgi:hypothetical protein
MTARVLLAQCHAATHWPVILPGNPTGNYVCLIFRRELSHSQRTCVRREAHTYVRQEAQLGGLKRGLTRGLQGGTPQASQRIAELCCPLNVWVE